MYQRRLKRLIALLGLCFALIGMRLGYLQLAVKDVRDYAREKEVRPFRGAIVDRRGVLLAVDRPAFDVVVDYAQLSHPERWLEPLRRASGTPREVILARRDEILERVRRVRGAVERGYRSRGRSLPESFEIEEERSEHALLLDVSLEVVARIEGYPERFRLPAKRAKRRGTRAGRSLVRIRARRKRAYPLGATACHLLGYIGERRLHAGGGPRWERPGDAVGVAGLEKQYDAQLCGRYGCRFQAPDLKTRAYQTVEEIPARPGHTAWLTIDSRLQRSAEAALGEHAGGVVLMDVNNGEVLVLASRPGYENNTCAEKMRELSADTEGRPLLNRAIQDPVPSGSVIKVAVAAAGLQSGTLTDRTTLECTGVLRIGEWAFRCSRRWGHGRVALEEAIERSCNVYFFRLGRRLGGQAVADWAERMGLGHRTGIDVPYEWAGRIPSPDQRRRAGGGAWRPGDTLNLSIGQGNVQVTPIQVAVMMAAVANGGWRVRPRVLMKVVDAAGMRVHLANEDARVRRTRVGVDARHLAAIRRGLEKVVAGEGGTARKIAALRQCRAAGKTGTAETGDEDVNYAWFAGYAPANKPEVCVAVVVHRVAGHGGEVAGPIAGQVLKAYFRNRRGAAGDVARGPDATGISD